MRERRWESQGSLGFAEVFDICGRLRGLGLAPAVPDKEMIGYVEEWTVKTPDEIRRLDSWPKEDVTLVHVREGWKGDFFLLAGAYHTIYQRYQGSGTYCSVSHPWRIPDAMQTHQSQAMLWLGFRHTYAFIRVRLHTNEIITPDEIRDEDRRPIWVEERRRAFMTAISVLDLPIEPTEKNGRVVLQTSEKGAALLCSWPDAFGPCQFEYNRPNSFEFLVPASRLAATHGGEPVMVRTYLTGFSQAALMEFQTTGPGVRYTYRCSVHCRLDEIPEILQSILPDGRIYGTLCEFQTPCLFPNMEEAWVIIGLLGMNAAGEGRFKIEARLNRAPLPEDEMPGWLEKLWGIPVAYAPLPPYP